MTKTHTHKCSQVFLGDGGCWVTRCLPWTFGDGSEQHREGTHRQQRISISVWGQTNLKSWTLYRSYTALFSRRKHKLRSRSGRWRLGCHLRKQIILMLLSEKASNSMTNFSLLLARSRSIRICTGSRLRKRGGDCPGCFASGWLLAARQPNVKNGRGCKKILRGG